MGPVAVRANAVRNVPLPFRRTTSPALRRPSSAWTTVNRATPKRRTSCASLRNFRVSYLPLQISLRSASKIILYFVCSIV